MDNSAAVSHSSAEPIRHVSTESLLLKFEYTGESSTERQPVQVKCNTGEMLTVDLMCFGIVAVVEINSSKTASTGKRTVSNKRTERDRGSDAETDSTERTISCRTTAERMSNNLIAARRPSLLYYPVSWLAPERKSTCFTGTCGESWAHAPGRPPTVTVTQCHKPAMPISGV